MTAQSTTRRQVWKNWGESPQLNCLMLVHPWPRLSSQLGWLAYRTLIFSSRTVSARKPSSSIFLIASWGSNISNACNRWLRSSSPCTDWSCQRPIRVRRPFFSTLTKPSFILASIPQCNSSTRSWSTSMDKWRRYFIFITIDFISSTSLLFGVSQSCKPPLRGIYIYCFEWGICTSCYGIS
jgi:hypothetical protein